MLSSEERELMFKVADSVNFEIDNPQKLSDYVKPLCDFIKSNIKDWGKWDEYPSFVKEWYADTSLKLQIGSSWKIVT